ncbi:MAG: glycosyltransferase, partial [Cyanobacteria bacterium P01_C01_bin.72]
NAPAKYTVSENNHSCLRAFNLDKSQYLLYLGTFEPDQRLDLLIEVFQKLQPHNWKLVLAGDISYSYQHGSKLLQMTRQQHNIIFTGEIGGNFLGELVRGADIFVNPSNGNNLCSSVAMLEAMREGVPIVASDTENHRQLIGRDRGLLFRAGQFDSLLIQLKYAMSRPKLLLAMAKKAQTYIAVNHNWDKVIYKNLFLYLQLTTKITLQPSPQTFERR